MFPEQNLLFDLMCPEMLKGIAEIIKASAWVVGVVGGVGLLGYAMCKRIPLRFKRGETELAIVAEPGQKVTPPSVEASAKANESIIATIGADALDTSKFSGVVAADGIAELPPVSSGSPIPSDYIYLVHTSFLRPDKQAEFRARTHISVPHYDIRVKAESYYAGALDRIRHVEYLLHKSFPNPIQARYDRADGFLLREIANGEFVLTAKVYLKDEREPLVLPRYITLWPEGPKID